MDITLALRRAVRGYAHGTDALAAELGISPTSLNHKVSPTYAGAHCSPEETCEIQEITGDHGAFEAMAACLGYVALRMPRAEDAGPAAAVMAKVISEFGHLMSETAQALADGVITANELARIEREGAHALHAVHGLMTMCAKLHSKAAAA